MKSHGWKCICSLLVAILISRPGLSQEDDILGDPTAAAEEDGVAVDANAEDFKDFSIFPNETPQPNDEEAAEMAQFNASGKAKAEQGDLDGALDDFEKANLVVPNFTSFLEIGRIRVQRVGDRGAQGNRSRLPGLARVQ